MHKKFTDKIFEDKFFIFFMLQRALILHVSAVTDFRREIGCKYTIVFTIYK